MPTPVIDPWLVNADGTPDPFASTVDFGMTSKDEVDPSLLDDEPQTPLNPDIVGNQPPAPSEEVVEEPPAPPAPPVEEPTGPEIVELEDGAFVTLERESKGWKATLDPGTGHAEVFWGNTKNELMVNVLKGKLNATKKIRELNKKVKLAAPARRQPVQETSQPTSRQLTADETFEIKALWESDPAAALDMLVKKRTNLSLDDLVMKAQKGDQANMNLETEAISREFLARNPEYYPDSENKNFQSLIKWLAKFKLGKTATESNAGDIFTELWQTGNYTVENLEEAFEDLTEDGLLIKPRLPKPSPPVEVNQQPVPQPAPAASTSRIVKTETRPRAALGIGRSDATAAPPPAPTAPTDEDLDNLSDEEIKALLGGVRRQKIAARRS
jgi:hypothetical protein